MFNALSLKWSHFDTHYLKKYFMFDIYPLLYIRLLYIDPQTID